MSVLGERLAGLLGRGALEQAPDVAQAVLRSDRFRLEREGDWKRLERIVAEIERGRLRKVSDEDLLALPALYRMAASSLSIARETSLDEDLAVWLESLTRRAWFVVYGPRAGLWRWLRGFLGGGWGAAVRGLGPDILIALAVMVAGTLVGWLLVASDPNWYYALAPSGDERVPGASRAVLERTLFGNADEPALSVFAAMLFSNNAQVSILAFALGFAFGVPTLLLLLHNTAMLGALLWLYHGQGLTFELVGWLSVHGTTELFAILLAGAAGLHVGRAMAFPGEVAVLDAAAVAGRRAALVMTGVVLMLIVAALLEAFARQLLDATAPRLIVGGFMLVFWIGYLFVWRRGR
ncbi:stage II sporulation protein M [Novosphingobium percolationis]|uniref:stage II sporulation protein M n=1 Tax=Novosphingobium percolationis TaxID=2871811 RepID=UPI001CD46EA7|nr:stage II sporulation protein M [Novosphingobium percolationis]